MSGTRVHKIWFGKLLTLGCAIVAAAAVVVGGSLDAEAKATRENSANQVSQFQFILPAS